MFEFASSQVAFSLKIYLSMLLAMTPQRDAASEALNSVLREEAHFTVIARHVMNFFCLINVHVAKQSPDLR
jgi:hypothetical protein